jgi:hypothetical protein
MPSVIRPTMPRRRRRRTEGKARPVRRRRRRPLRRTRLLLVLALVAAVVAFGAGFMAQRVASSRAVAAAPVAPRPAPAEQAAARNLLDRAVQARQAESDEEAVRLAAEAKRLDPGLPGLALFAAEMAVRQGQAEAAAVAAEEALAQGRYESDARLILALSAWMLRGQTGTEAAGRTATQLLAEAADAELSNGVSRFFAGDLLRAIGQPDAAHRSLLAALHRHEAWHSSALLEAKIAALTGETGPESAAARAIFTPRHLALLARDPAFAGSLPTSPGEPFVPFSQTAPPEPAGASQSSP